jgi:hypothetical protein
MCQAIFGIAVLLDVLNKTGVEKKMVSLAFGLIYRGF